MNKFIHVFAGSLLLCADSAFSQPAPVIGRQPQSLTAPIGASVSFATVTSKGTAVSFQWYVQGGNAIAGATNATLVLPGVQPTDAGGYYVVAQNAAGTATSAVATLTIPARELVFQTSAGGNNDIWKMQADGSARQQLTTNAADELNPMVSPDGQSIAYLRVAGTNRNIYVMNANGTGSQLVRSFSDAEFAGLQGWLPDGNSLLVQKHPAGQPLPGSVYAYNLGGTNETLFLDPALVGQSNVLGISFSRLGNKLVWIAEDGSTNHIAKLYAADYSAGNLVTSSVTQITFATNVYGNAFFSPDASKVVFASKTQSGSGLLQTVVADLAGTSQILIANPAQALVPSAWTPADKILLSGKWDLTNGSSQIWSVNPDGTSLNNLSNNGFDEANAQWLTPWSFNPQAAQITSGPAPQTAYTGSNAQFTVLATGTGALSYQWYYAGLPLTDATNATLSLVNVQFGQSGEYLVVVANAYGVAASQPVLLTVQAPPQLVIAPASQLAYVGTNASLSALVSGSAPLSYQWWFNGSPLTGGTNATLSLNNLQLLQAGSYQVIVSNPFGAITSAPVTMTVRTPTRIVFQSNRSGNYHLWVVNEDGSGLQQLTTSSDNEINPLVSPDNRFIAFTRMVSGGFEIHVINADGSNDRLIKSVTTPHGGGAQAWTTDGSALITIWNDPLCYIKAHRIGLDGTETGIWLDPAVVGKGAVTSLAISPRGDQVAFSAQVGCWAPDTELYLGMSSLGGVLTNSVSQLTSNAMVDLNPAFSWDGQNLAYDSSDTNGTHSLYVRNLINHTVTNLAGQLFSAETAAWVPDGRLLFAGRANNNAAQNIWLMQGDGTGMIQLTSGNYDESQPRWLPGVGGVAPVIIGQPAFGQPGVAGSNVTVSVELASATSLPVIYQWFLNGTAIAGATNSTLILSAVTNTQAGVYYVAVTNAFGTATSATTTLSVIDPPVITRTPTDQTVGLGSSVSFLVAVTGTGPMHYQWLQRGIAIPNATNPVLAIPSVQLSDMGPYMVVISNDYSAISASALLTVTELPTISTQPQSQGAILGGSATFSVEAFGAIPLQFQWLFNGLPLLGENAATLIMDKLTANNLGSYSVIVGNTFGSVTSSVVMLSAVTRPVITAPPQAVVVNAGGPAAFTVIANGGLLHYQWRKDGTDLPGAMAATLTLNNVQAVNAGSYAVVVSNSAGVTVSKPVDLMLNGPVIFTLQPRSQTIASHTTLTLPTKVTGTTPVSYQWLFNGANLAGQTKVTLSIAGTTTNHSGLYSVIVSNIVGPRTSDLASVVVMDQPAIKTQPKSITLRDGDSGLLTVVASGSPTLSYEWRKNDVVIPGANTATLYLDNAGAADAGRYTVRVSNYVGSMVSLPAIVTVKAAPVIVKQPENQANVLKNKASFSVSAVGSGVLTYQWFKNGVKLVNTRWITGVNTPVLSIANLQDTNVGNYSVVVSSIYGKTSSSQASLSLQALLTNPFTAASTTKIDQAGEIAFDGNNFLLTYQSGPSTIGAQLVAQSGSLLGNPLLINVGKLTDYSGPYVQYGNGQYLLVWSDLSANSIYGQRVNTNGTLLGARLTIANAKGHRSARGVAFDGDNFLVIWADARAGANQSTVYGRFVTQDGKLTGSELRLGEDTHYQEFPAVAFGGSHYYVTWQSQVGDQFNVYGRLVEKNGSMAQPFQLNQSGSAKANPMTLASDGNRFFALWNIWRSDQSAWLLYSVAISQDGAPLSSETPTATDAGSQIHPFLASDGNNYLAGWTLIDTTTNQSPNAAAQTYCQYFDHSGLPIGLKFPVFAPLGTNQPWSGKASYGVQDYLVNATLGYRTPSNSLLNGDVYALLVPRIGATEVAPVITSQPQNLDASISAGGNFCVNASGSGLLAYQWYKDGVALTNNLRIAGVTGSCLTISRLQITDSSTNYYVVITNRGGSVTSYPVALTVQAVVTTIAAPNAVERATGLAYDGLNYLVAFQTSPSAFGLQLMSRSGSLISSVIPMDQVTGTMDGDSGPRACFGAGRYLIVWSDAPTNNLYGQFVERNGTASGPQFEIATNTGRQFASGIAFDGANFLVVWADERNGANLPTVFGRLISANGIMQPEMQLGANGVYQTYPAVTYGNGCFLVTWQSGYTNLTMDAPVNVIGRFVTSNRISTPFQINETTSLRFNPMALSFDGSKFLALWNTWQTNTAWQVNGRFVTTNGIAIGNQFPVATGTGSQILPAVAFDGVDYLIAWTLTSPDFSTAQTYFQRYNISGSPVDDKFQVFTAQSNSMPWAVNMLYDGQRYLATVTLGQFATNQALISGDVYVAFIDPAGVVATRPVITSQPQSQTLRINTNAAFCVSAVGTAPMSYQWFKDGLRIYGATNQCMVIPAANTNDQGNYWVRVANEGGSVTSSIAFLTIETHASLVVQTSGNGSVLPQSTNTLLDLSKTYSFTAKPAPGYLLTYWTLNGAVVSTNQTYTFTLVSNSSLTAYFAINPQYVAKGDYLGLFMPEPTNAAAPGASVVQFTNSGLLKLTLTEKGTFTGKLLVEGATLNFTGNFAQNGWAQVNVPRTGKSPLQMALNLLRYDSGVTGTVSDGVWNSRAEAYLKDTSTSNQLAGAYTLGLSPSVNIAGGGEAAITVSRAGIALVTGTLPESTVLTYSAPLSVQGLLPVYIPLYGGKGMLMGWLNLQNPHPFFMSELNWQKPVAPTDSYYTNGIVDAPLAQVSRYVTPTNGNVTGWTYGQISFHGGNLPPTNALGQSWTAYFVVSNAQVRVWSGNLSNLTLSINAASGQITGSFTHPVTQKTTAIKGILHQQISWFGMMSSSTFGDGWFLGANESGGFSLFSSAVEAPHDRTPNTLAGYYLQVNQLGGTGQTLVVFSSTNRGAFSSSWAWDTNATPFFYTYQKTGSNLAALQITAPHYSSSLALAFAATNATDILATGVEITTLPSGQVVTTTITNQIYVLSTYETNAPVSLVSTQGGWGVYDLLTGGIETLSFSSDTRMEITLPQTLNSTEAAYSFVRTSPNTGILTIKSYTTLQLDMIFTSNYDAYATGTDSDGNPVQWLIQWNGPRIPPIVYLK
ncbi:MAG: immunoglobulin domain-containing protein [Verrucomicrobiota bacterium]